MIVGPARLIPTKFTLIIGARDAAISWWKMTCSISVAPRPPYSFGHEIPAHPASASWRSHPRANWSFSSNVSGSR